MFQTVTAAEEALPTVHDLDDRQDHSVRDAAIVIRTESGRIELVQTHEVAGAPSTGAGDLSRLRSLLTRTEAETSGAASTIPGMPRRVPAAIVTLKTTSGFRRRVAP